LKMSRYRQAASNLYAVVVEPHEILVEIHARSRNWEPVVLRQREIRSKCRNSACAARSATSTAERRSISSRMSGAPFGRGGFQTRPTGARRYPEPPAVPHIAAGAPIGR